MEIDSRDLPELTRTFNNVVSFEKSVASSNENAEMVNEFVEIIEILKNETSLMIASLQEDPAQIGGLVRKKRGFKKKWKKFVREVKKAYDDVKYYWDRKVKPRVIDFLARLGLLPKQPEDLPDDFERKLLNFFYQKYFTIHNF